MTTPAPPPPWSLAALDALTPEALVSHLGRVVEHSPWVVQRAAQARPFGSYAALLRSLEHTIHTASLEEQLTLLRAHPELAGREAVAGVMTPESNAEQMRLGLLELTRANMSRLIDANRRYRERFAYPFVVALRLHDSIDSVFGEFERRIVHEHADELPVALQQVCEVMRGRLSSLVAADPSALAATP